MNLNCTLNCSSVDRDEYFFKVCYHPNNEGARELGKNLPIYYDLCMMVWKLLNVSDQLLVMGKHFPVQMDLSFQCNHLRLFQCLMDNVQLCNQYLKEEDIIRRLPFCVNQALESNNTLFLRIIIERFECLQTVNMVTLMLLKYRKRDETMLDLLHEKLDNIILLQ